MRLVIPFEPPSGNHYKTYRAIGGFVRWYLTSAAKAWDRNVFMEAAKVAKCYEDGGDGRLVAGKAHQIHYTVYQGAGSRGDVDNYAKCILDSLVKAGVLKSDASVVSLHCHKVRDRNNPRTEITVEAI